MTVKVYGIAAKGYKTLDPTHKRFSNFGNGLNFGNGIILTASHLFNEKFPDNSVFTADSQYFGVNEAEAGGNNGIAVSAPQNLYAYNPAAPSGTDLAIVNAGFSLDSGPITPVVVFADQIAAANFLTKHPNITLSTITPDNGNPGAFQGIIGNSNANTGEEIKTTIAATDGDSGGVATVVAGKNNTTYAVGILSSSDQNHQNARFTTINDTAYVEANAAVGQGVDTSSMPTDLIVGDGSKEYIRGSYRKANIITNGDNDVILAGSGGGLINTGTGQNDVIFLPGAVGQDDPGTTIVLSPGSTTVVGGGPNDKLVFLTDRLYDGLTAPGTPDDVSSVVQMTDVWGSTSIVSDDDKMQLSPIYYSYSRPYGGAQAVGWSQTNGDFTIYYSTGSRNGDDYDVLWSGEITLKDFQEGDFGIYPATVAGGYPDSNVQGIDSVDDDSTIAWTNGDAMFASAPTSLSQAEIDADLAAVIANTQGDLTSLTPPPPPTSGDQTFADDDVTASIAAGATATVTGNNDAITALGANSTIDFGGTGETASISAGAVNLWDGASVTMTGDDDVVTLNADGMLSVSGGGNTINVGAAGNTVTTDQATLNLWDDAGASVTGTGNVINLNAGDSLSVSGPGNRVTVSGTGNSVSIAAGEVDLWDGAAARVSGDGNAVVANSGNTLTVAGADTRLTINGSGNTITLTGPGTSATVGGTGNSLAASAAAVAFFDGSGGTVTGAGNSLTLYDDVTASVVGADSSAVVAGMGDTLSIANGAVSLWNGASATINGNGNDFTLYDDTSLTTAGTGAAVTVSGQGTHVSAGAATVAFDDGASGTVTGDGNTLVLNSGDAVTASGAALRATLQGTGDVLNASSASVGLTNAASATLNGDNDTATFYGAASLASSGHNDSFVFTASPGTATLGGFDASDQITFDHTTFATWQTLLGHASQSGTDTLISTDATHVVTLQNVTLSSLKQSQFHFA